MTRIGSTSTPRVARNTLKAGAQQLDGALLEQFLAAAKTSGVSAKEVKTRIARHLSDHGSLSRQEKATLLFAARHLKIGVAADRELGKLLRQLDPGGIAGTSGTLVGKNEYLSLVDTLERRGKLALLYTAKTVMTNKQMNSLWDQGMSLAELNGLVEKGLKPASPAALRKLMGGDVVEEALAVMKPEEKRRFNAGQLSPGELQNIIYRGWEAQDPSIKGLTPYDPHFKAKYQPIL